MKFNQKIVNILLLIYIIIYPILPMSYIFFSDLILYTLIILQIMSFLFIPKERAHIFNIINNIYKDKIFITLILLNLAMYFSAIVSSDLRVSVTNSIRFTMYIFIFYSITYKIKNSTCKLLFNSFILVSILSGLCTIGQIIYTKSLGYKIDKTMRMSSFLENSNNLGSYSILIFFIVIMLLFTAKNIKYKIFYGISSLVLLINIMFSQSRNALLSLILGIFIIVVLYDKRFIIFSLIFPVVFFLIPTVKARIFQIFDMSQNSSRFNIWHIAILIIKQNPIFGIGYENFSIEYPSYVANNPEWFVKEGYLPLHPHNVFLKFQSELGILGTILLIAFISYTIVTLYNSYKFCKNKTERSLIIGTLTSFLTFLFMNLIDCYFNTPKVITTMIITLAFINHYKINSNSLTNDSIKYYKC